MLSDYISVDTFNLNHICIIVNKLDYWYLRMYNFKPIEKIYSNLKLNKNAKNVCKIAKVIELTNDNIRIGFIIKSIVIKRCIEKE